MADYALLFCIVNHEKGSRVLRVAKTCGVPGGTIFLGRGTVNSRLLQILDLDDSRKEIVLMAAPRDIATAAAGAIAKDLAFHKPGHGVGFIVSLRAVHGAHNCENKTNRTEEVHMHDLIYTIVEKGLAADVVDAARAAGAIGGTIVNARGSGIHETEMLFAMPVEPEREMVLCVVDANITDAVAASIKEKLSLDEPGNGILFVCGVREAYGLQS